MKTCLLAVLALVTMSCATHAPRDSAPASFEAMRWTQLPPIPDKEGFAGMFAGVSRGTLLVAGGANFPNKKPWENGAQKVWYDTVWALEDPGPNGTWTAVGKLPGPRAYGVSAAWGDGVVCVGGSDAGGHHADALRIELKDGKLVTTPLPPLPTPLANTCGAVVGNMLYVAGGLAEPDAQETLRVCFGLDLMLDDAKWREVEPWPGPARMLACAASFDGEFYLFGGVDLSPDNNGDGKPERRYLTDAYRYHPIKGWRRLADLPRCATASPSPAPATTLGPVVLGGDDGSQMHKPLDEFDPFPNHVMQYDARANVWRDVGEIPVPTVAVPVAKWNDMWVVPNGERLPGVRTPQVWALTPRKASR